MSRRIHNPHFTTSEKDTPSNTSRHIVDSKTQSIDSDTVHQHGNVNKYEIPAERGVVTTKSNIDRQHLIFPGSNRPMHNTESGSPRNREGHVGHMTDTLTLSSQNQMSTPDSVRGQRITNANFTRVTGNHSESASSRQEINKSPASQRSKKKLSVCSGSSGQSLTLRSLPTPSPPNSNITWRNSRIMLSSVNSSINDADVCRICHCGGSEEQLMSPCYCSGSIGKLHLSCLQRWLGTSNKTNCELCNFKFTLQRKTKPFIQYLRNPGTARDKKNLVCDIACFSLLTPLTCVTAWLCIQSAIQLRDTTWEHTGLVFLSICLLVLYGAWLAVCVRHHYTSWNDWKQFNQLVTLKCVPPSVISSQRNKSDPRSTSVKNNAASGRELSSMKIQVNRMCCPSRPESKVPPTRGSVAGGTTPDVPISAKDRTSTSRYYDSEPNTSQWSRNHFKTNNQSVTKKACNPYTVSHSSRCHSVSDQSTPSSTSCDSYGVLAPQYAMEKRVTESLKTTPKTNQNTATQNNELILDSSRLNQQVENTYENVGSTFYCHNKQFKPIKNNQNAPNSQDLHQEQYGCQLSARSYQIGRSCMNQGSSNSGQYSRSNPSNDLNRTSRDAPSLEKKAGSTPVNILQRNYTSLPRERGSVAEPISDLYVTHVAIPITYESGAYPLNSYHITPRSVTAPHEQDKTSTNTLSSVVQTPRSALPSHEKDSYSLERADKNMVPQDQSHCTPDMNNRNKNIHKQNLSKSEPSRNRSSDSASKYTPDLNKTTSTHTRVENANTLEVQMAKYKNYTTEDLPSLNPNSCTEEDAYTSCTETSM